MPKVFICYSHSDEKLRAELTDHLGNLHHLGIDPWSDRRISGGADWLAEIAAAIEACDAAVLLVSSKFLNSGFIKTVEVPELLDASQKRGTLVIPLIARPCNWQKHAWLAAMQARPWEGRPIMAMGPNARAIVLSQLALEIERGTSPSRVPVGSGSNGAVIEVTLDGAHDLDDLDLQRAVAEAIKTVAGGADVRIARRTKGSLKLLVELPAEAVARLRGVLERGFFQPPGLRITGEGLWIELFTLREKAVFLDETLAQFFDIPVKHINQARDRNRHRFDDSHAFQLTDAEWADLKSQIVTAKTGRGGRRTPPWAYTDKGVAMLATVLRTPRAVEASKLIVETFVAARNAAQPVPPMNHDGIGDPEADNPDKQAFKARLRAFDRR